MKGVPGLLFAVGLGVVGAFCNWLYLAQKGKELEHVDFIIMAKGVRINPGDKFTLDHLDKVSVPKSAVGGLDKTAYLYDLRFTVVGQAATKPYSEGEVLLRQDLLTAPPPDIKKLLEPDEVVQWLPVDTRTFVPALVNAGDQVSFVGPRMGGEGPARADEGGDSAARAAGGPTEILGPFRILALGNRLGSQDVLRAAGITATQENVMAVAVRIVNNELEPKAQRLSDVLRLTNFQHVQVLLHPPKGGTKDK